MTQTARENAIHTWLVTATGLAPEKVIWEHQTGTRPLDAFATLRLDDVTTVGPFDTETDHTDLTRPAGQEVELRIEGERLQVCRVQLFAHEVTGDTSASALLIKAQTRLGLPSVMAAFDASAGLAVADRGTVHNISALLGTSRFESRASVDVTFAFIETASDLTGYIDSVIALGSVTVDESGDINITLDTASP